MLLSEAIEFAREQGYDGDIKDTSGGQPIAAFALVDLAGEGYSCHQLIRGTEPYICRVHLHGVVKYNIGRST